MWFVYDPDNGFELYATEDAAKTALEQAVERYREDACDGGDDWGWDSDVERICMGRVTHEVELLDVTVDVLPGLIESGEASEGDEFWEAYIREVP